MRTFNFFWNVDNGPLVQNSVLSALKILPKHLPTGNMLHNFYVLQSILQLHEESGPPTLFLPLSIEKQKLSILLPAGSLGSEMVVLSLIQDSFYYTSPAIKISGQKARGSIELLPLNQ